MTDPKVAVLGRYFEELFNQGRTELVTELLHPDYVNHSPGSPDQPRTREAVADVVRWLRSVFPDLHYTIEDCVVGSDAVAVRTTMRGTHRAPFLGVEPTGRRVEVSQITIEHFRGTQIIAHHRVTDMLALLQQLEAQR
jgi:steroid delta-isomerase-like uncharacterized protein